MSQSRLKELALVQQCLLKFANQILLFSIDKIKGLLYKSLLEYTIQEYIINTMNLPSSRQSYCNINSYCY